MYFLETFFAVTRVHRTCQILSEPEIYLQLLVFSGNCFCCVPHSARFFPNQKYIYSCLFSLGNVGNCFCCVPHSARLLQFSRMHAPPSSILHTMMTFANPPNSHRFKPYHSKQKAGNEVWNWIKFPFSFVGFAQCPARCYAMISMQAGQMKTDARSIPRCKEIFPLKL